MTPALARSALLERLDQLGVRDAAITRHLRGKDGRNEADFGDRPAITGMDEVLEQLDGAARQEMEAIQAAVLRLDNGTYGVCVGCGESIAAKRLAILPHTPQCVACG
jgi:RNA polymerase-binding transcription factor DksA